MTPNFTSEESEVREMTYVVKQSHISGYSVFLEGVTTRNGVIYKATLVPMTSENCGGYPISELTNSDLKKATQSYYYLCGKAKSMGGGV